MNSTRKKVMPMAVLTACFALHGLTALGQGSQVTAGSDPQTHQDSVTQPDPSANLSNVSTTGEVAKFNKASSIIGTDVRNEKDEHLGQIKDVVIDLQSERVAYAVLSTGGILGRGGKLLAVPLSAFSASEDQKHLILHADKSKMEAAMGFDKNSWPSPNNTTWGAEPFWQSQTNRLDIPVKIDKNRDNDLSPKSTPESQPRSQQ
jgi:sporulation protein YlmC with PRC-barrel domain